MTATLSPAVERQQDLRAGRHPHDRRHDDRHRRAHGSRGPDQLHHHHLRSRGRRLVGRHGNRVAGGRVEGRVHRVARQRELCHRRQPLDGQRRRAANQLDRAVGFISGQGGAGQSMGRTSYVGDDIVGVAHRDGDHVTVSQITLTRDSTVGAADFGWFVVQFDGGSGFKVGSFTKTATRRPDDAGDRARTRTGAEGGHPVDGRAPRRDLRQRRGHHVARRHVGIDHRRRRRWSCRTCCRAPRSATMPSAITTITTATFSTASAQRIAARLRRFRRRGRFHRDRRDGRRLDVGAGAAREHPERTG